MNSIWKERRHFVIQFSFQPRHSLGTMYVRIFAIPSALCSQKSTRRTLPQTNCQPARNCLIVSRSHRAKSEHFLTSMDHFNCAASQWSVESDRNCLILINEKLHSNIMQLFRLNRINIIIAMRALFGSSGAAQCGRIEKGSMQK